MTCPVVNLPENISNLVSEKVGPITKPERYVSKYRPAVVLETKSAKVPMKTMGPANVEISTPDKYLKKYSKQPILSKNILEFHYDCKDRKPELPHVTDIPVMGLHTSGFIKPDTPVLKRPKPACVYTKMGHKQLLEDSGLIPKYIKKKYYGEVPKYLQLRNEEEQRTREKFDNFLKEQRRQEAKRYLPEEERQAVLEGLKKNRDNALCEYQILPFITDTLSKKCRKQRIETTLNQLDNDINLFDRFRVKIPARE